MTWPIASLLNLDLLARHQERRGLAWDEWVAARPSGVLPRLEADGLVELVAGRDRVLVRLTERGAQVAGAAKLVRTDLGVQVQHPRPAVEPAWSDTDQTGAEVALWSLGLGRYLWRRWPAGETFADEGSVQGRLQDVFAELVAGGTPGRGHRPFTMTIPVKTGPSADYGKGGRQWTGD